MLQRRWLKLPAVPSMSSSIVRRRRTSTGGSCSTPLATSEPRIVLRRRCIPTDCTLVRTWKNSMPTSSTPYVPLLTIPPPTPLSPYPRTVQSEHARGDPLRRGLPAPPARRRDEKSHLHQLRRGGARGRLEGALLRGRGVQRHEERGEHGHDEICRAVGGGGVHCCVDLPRHGRCHGHAAPAE